MASKFIALTAVIALLADIVRLPLPGMATAAASPAEHNHHHCCPQLEQTRVAAVVPALPSLPCGPNHSCCVVRAPAKLPSLPAGSNGKANRQVAHAIEVSLPIPDTTSAVPDTKSLAIRHPLDLNAVLRV